jgi:hypothetical protein
MRRSIKLFPGLHRSSKTNIIYAGSVETPADSWVDQTLRGHVTAGRIYDPTEPDHTLREEEPLWDAGEVLSSMNPDERRIYFPDLDVRRVEDEYLTDEAGQQLIGDGVRVNFSGFLAHSPVLATTLRIYDGHPEVFIDSGMAALKGSLGGKGIFDRFTGRWEVTFNRPPQPACRSWPVTAGTLSVTTLNPLCRRT